MAQYVEIFKHEEESFKPLVFFESWRVAVLNYGDIVTKERLDGVERHMETDEVFVHLSGECYLAVGTDHANPADFQVIKMKPKVIYNIKKAVWHHIVMDREGSVLIVENADTGKENSEHYDLPGDQKEKILQEIDL